MHADSEACRSSLLPLSPGQQSKRLEASHVPRLSEYAGEKVERPSVSYSGSAAHLAVEPAHEPISAKAAQQSFPAQVPSIAVFEDR